MEIKQVSKNSRSISKPWQLIAILAILQLLITFLNGSMTFSSEESMWHYIGRNWIRNGLVPYSGGVDNKSPLIFLIFGISDWLFGVSIWFPRIIGILIQSMGIYYLFKIVKYLAGSRAGFIAISLYGLSLLWKSTGGRHVSFTETYAVAAIIISFYYFLVAENFKSYFISGLLAALAIGFRLSACFGTCAILVSSIRRGGKQGLSFLLGLLSGLVLLVLIFSLAGINLNDLYIHAFADNFGSGSTTDHSLSWKVETFINTFFHDEILLFYAPVIGYFLIQRKIDPVMLWLIFEFVGINALGIYARPHFKSILPPLCIASAFALNYLIENYKLPAKAVFLIVWIAFFPKTQDPIFGLKTIVDGFPDTSIKNCELPYEQPDDYSQQRLGLWLKNNSRIDDTIFVAGYGARVQVFSERLSPTIYFNVTQTPSAKKQLYHDLSSTPPDVIAVPLYDNYKKYVNQDVRDFIDSLIKEKYDSPECKYGYNVFKRR